MHQILRPDWDSYFMEMVAVVKTRSPDPNTKIGCVIVGPDNAIVATGYNGLPPGINHRAERLERPNKYSWFSHAETASIGAAARKGIALGGCKLFINGLPCINCTHLIIQSGIKEVIFDADNQKKWVMSSPKYGPDWSLVEEILKEAGIEVIPWTKNE